MSNVSQNEVQKSVYTLLNNDATLSGLITGVYDKVASSIVYPYVIVEEITAKPWESRSFNGTEFTLRVQIHSRGGGKKEAADIMQQILSLLHHTSFTIIGANLILSQLINSNIALQRDGITHTGSMQFQIFAHSSA